MKSEIENHTTTLSTTTINTNPTNASPPYTSDSGGNNACGSDKDTGTPINQQGSAHAHLTTTSTSTNTNPTPVSPCLSESANDAGSESIIGAATMGTRPVASGKTRLCSYYAYNKQCPYGNSCTLAHGSAEFQPPPGYKTVLCRYFSGSGCRFGPVCTFAHGEEELRGPAPPAPTHVEWLPRDDGIVTSQLSTSREQEEACIAEAIYSTRQARLPFFSQNLDPSNKLSQARNKKK